MLKLVNLKKDYVLKGQSPVHALKGISVNFRRNEFVAILGPSGCGKTTLLNLVGGLDRYTSGDLIIEGKSTKNYKDNDWDTYRNHSVGFVFQSYNLIGHQTILNNVELALTISGISKKERKERAMAALDQVGLKGQYKKRPNQLSGGQMQRVAIARSLVNNPEILLADEPTGALDSETSIQIMDLLKEVAQNRLVVMVTHNPELAEQYATRIVSMKDGVVLSDTNPYEGETKEELAKALADKKEIIAQKGKAKSSMSFFTATGLSFSNLISKLKRTVLITIAGSIGIIGVSAVLAVSQGVNNYVDGMQDDMLSSYPVTITETSIDYASLMGGLSNWDKNQVANTDLTNKIAVDSMIRYLMEKYRDFTKVKTNEINDDLVDFVKSIPEEYISSIDLDYGIDLTNNVFTSWQRDNNDPSSKEMMSLNGLTQMYISELSTVRDFSDYAQFVDLFTNFMKQLPAGEEYILSQYDLVGDGSRFATNENEIMLVVDDNQSLTDISLAQLGFFSEDEFLNIARYAIEFNKDTSKFTEEEMAKHNELLEQYKYPETFEISKVLGKEFVYYPHDEIYTYENKQAENIKFTFTTGYDEEGNPTNIVFNLLYDAGSDTLAGDVKIAGTTYPGVAFERVGTKDPVNNEVGTWKGIGSIASMFQFNLAILPGPSRQASMVVGFNPSTLEPIVLTSNYSYSLKDISGYRYSAFADPKTPGSGTEVKIVGILKAKPETRFGSLSRGVYYTPALTRKYINDSMTSEIITNAEHGLEAYIGSEAETRTAFKAYTTYTYTSFINGDENPIANIPGEAMCLNTSTAASFSSMFAISGTSYKDYDIGFLRSLSGLAAKDLGKEGYAFDDLPKTISIFPKDFSKKNRILRYLDKWNEDGDLSFNGTTLAQDKREELTYTDTIGMIITVIDTLINAITIALVAFTSLALVVSCFMIAVITYISTMERVKEIGIIRSIGGRKKDISRLFIAETLIIGTASGVFGIIITEVICAILNIVVAPFGVGTMAVLMPMTILIMILLSVVLNVLSGLIPSMRASNQDPVIALRSE